MELKINLILITLICVACNRTCPELPNENYKLVRNGLNEYAVGVVGDFNDYHCVGLGACYGGEFKYGYIGKDFGTTIVYRDFALAKFFTDSCKAKNLAIRYYKLDAKVEAKELKQKLKETLIQ